MHALQFSGPALDGSTTTVAEVPDPRPGPGQVAIAASWAGVNFKDVMQRRGDPGYVDGYPFVPGLEVSGTVRAVGADVPEDWLRRLGRAGTPHAGLAGGGVAGPAPVARPPEGPRPPPP